MINSGDAQHAWLFFSTHDKQVQLPPRAIKVGLAGLGISKFVFEWGW
jgi:hypothetical protein